MAIIKANAYGHGLVPAARALADADAFGVARLEEGLALRDAGLKQTIVLLEGVFSAEDLAIAAARGCEIVVHSRAQLALLEEWAGPGQIPVWFKIDSGMNRLGFRLEYSLSAWERLIRTGRVLGAPRIMTHLAVADERSDGRTLVQIRDFENAVATLPGSAGAERSVANSAAVLAWPQARADWVRPGLMLYGISPFQHESAGQLNLKPAMTLTTRLIAVGEVAPGEGVGYGAAWRATRRSLIGIAAVGYGDGYPRHMKSGSPVLVNGRKTWLAGRVSMDMIAVDITDAPAAVGDPVVLWGEGLPAEQMALHADTIPYELVCGVSQRVQVEYEERG
jgi:alanine racemase